MPPDLPVPASSRRVLSSLDHRIEAVTGQDVDTLWAHRDRGLLDDSHDQLVDRHRDLARATTTVTFFRTLLHRLSSGEFPVDGDLLERIDRTVDQLEEAAEARDATARQVIAALAPIETAANAAPAAGGEQLSADDRAALLAIVGGAKLHEHLMTNRKSVTTGSGTRIPYAQLERLESAGLVSRDTGHPLHAGQPVTLTEAGRAALVDARHSTTRHVPTPAARPPGAWPPSPSHRR